MLERARSPSHTAHLIRSHDPARDNVPRSSQLAGDVEDETEPVPDLGDHCTTDVPGHLVALLIAAGENPYVISQRLGHASIRTTYDIYGHLFEGRDRQAADALEADRARSLADSPRTPRRSEGPSLGL